VLVRSRSGWYGSYSVGRQTVRLVRKSECWYVIGPVGKEATARL